MRTIINKIQNFLEKSQNTTTKEFIVFLCLNFSFLINGLILILLSMYPICSNLPENSSRMYIGSFLIAIWFILLPNISREQKDKAISRLIYSSLTILALIFIVRYWLMYFSVITFRFTDIVIILISIPTVAYLLYCFINLVKLIFLVIQRTLHKILPSSPKKEENRGLKFILESITSIFVAISSFIGAFWGIVTAIKTMFK